MTTVSDDGFAAWTQHCPIPLSASAQRISLAHGEGARLSRQLISEVILPRLSPGGKSQFADAARVTTIGCRLAICTDSHTVSPIFFPGGDIGSLSVYGTVNDLVVSGAHARWLTMSLILEEGLPIGILEQILDSAARAALECGVAIVTGDTKVVPRGAVDGIFINTAGIGEIVDPAPPGPSSIRAGDTVLVSGPVGRHGIAVLSAREQLALKPAPQSDSGSLIRQVHALRDTVGEHLRAMRDATRGGVSAVLHEWMLECDLTVRVEETAVPVTEDVRGVCELLGLDPLYAANEGTLVAVVKSEFAEAAVSALKRVPGCELAAVIGSVIEKEICPVTVHRAFGAAQPLDEPSGAPLPRIC